MKQIIQNYKTGKIEIEDVAIPLCKSGGVLVRTVNSLISVGTEKSVIDLGKKSLLGKARARPDLFKQALAKAKKEGFWKTFQEAMNRLDTPMPLGYSSAGVVMEVGNGVDEFSVGDRVACIGQNFASHSEVVSVPQNLCVKLPKRRISPSPVSSPAGGEEQSRGEEYLSFEEASFGMLGIIALHGVRCAKVELGQKVAVIGLGLLGQITVQLLKSAGCKVIGSDIDEKKCSLAKQLGADDAVLNSDLVSRAVTFSGGYGVDTVIITAAAKTNEPIELAAEICRFSGRVILVGVVDINIPRKIFWEKEIEFMVSRAGGPGTFDPYYELEGIDYPIGYVRWTEKRNLAEFLSLIAQNKIDVKSLITHRFDIENGLTAYDMVMNNTEPYLGVELRYKDSELVIKKEKILLPKIPLNHPLVKGEISIGVIGAGLFAKSLLLPNLKKIGGLQLTGIATASGVTANHIGKKFGFKYTTTNYQELINDSEINCVFVLTRHNLHAKMVIECLKAGKHVFVEKPLCVVTEELKEIKNVYESLVSDGKQLPVLMVGFNRRYSPLTDKVKEFFRNRQQPMVLNFRVNAGFIPKEHWVQGEEGGGRIVGEVCHYVDLAQFIVGSYPESVYAQKISTANAAISTNDNLITVLKFNDGSIATITYTAVGDKAFSRERFEMFTENSVAVIEDFREATFVRQGNKTRVKLPNQNIGYLEELQTFFDAVQAKKAPVSVNDYLYSMMATFGIEESLKDGLPKEIIIA